MVYENYPLKVKLNFRCQKNQFLENLSQIYLYMEWTRETANQYTQGLSIFLHLLLSDVTTAYKKSPLNYIPIFCRNNDFLL